MAVVKFLKDVEFQLDHQASIRIEDLIEDEIAGNRVRHRALGAVGPLLGIRPRLLDRAREGLSLLGAVRLEICSSHRSHRRIGQARSNDPLLRLLRRCGDLAAKEFHEILLGGCHLLGRYGCSPGHQ